MFPNWFVIVIFILTWFLTITHRAHTERVQSRLQLERTEERMLSVGETNQWEQDCFCNPTFPADSCPQDHEGFMDGWSQLVK